MVLKKKSATYEEKDNNEKIKRNCHKYHIRTITFHVYTNHFYLYF